MDPKDGYLGSDSSSHPRLIDTDNSGSVSPDEQLGNSGVGAAGTSRAVDC